MKNTMHLMNERLAGNLMKPLIDECGIIHITYMATALFFITAVTTSVLPLLLAPQYSL